eukprot:gene56701-biopygen110115
MSSPTWSGSCGFETMLGRTYCGVWADALGDQFDWTRGSGGTPTGSTGPSGAHDGQYYLFVETSSPTAPGDTATLEALAQNAGFLSLWYTISASSASKRVMLVLGTWRPC